MGRKSKPWWTAIARQPDCLVFDVIANAKIVGAHFFCGLGSPRLLTQAIVSHLPHIEQHLTHCFHY